MSKEGAVAAVLSASIFILLVAIIIYLWKKNKADERAKNAAAAAAANASSAKAMRKPVVTDPEVGVEDPDRGVGMGDRDQEAFSDDESDGASGLRVVQREGDVLEDEEERDGAEEETTIADREAADAAHAAEHEARRKAEADAAAKKAADEAAAREAAAAAAAKKAAEEETAAKKAAEEAAAARKAAEEAAAKKAAEDAAAAKKEAEAAEAAKKANMARLLAAEGRRTSVRDMLVAKKAAGDKIDHLMIGDRHVPMKLIESTDMIAVSHPMLMRLLIKNQNQVSRVFRHYSDEESMSLDSMQRLATEMDITPDFCTPDEVADVFALVNASEASGGLSDSLDAEEFSELLVRLGVFYAPGDHDVRTSPGVVSAVEALFMHMNESDGAKGMEPPIKFTAHKKRK